MFAFEKNQENRNNFECNENTSDSISLHETSEYHAQSLNLNENQTNFKKRTLSSKVIFAYVFLFGVRVILSSGLWNYFMQNYQDLLMRFSLNPIQRVISFIPAFFASQLPLTCLIFEFFNFLACTS